MEGRIVKTTETLGKISDALSKAQAILTNPAKDAENPHFRNRYATLDAGLTIVRAALSKNGIAFTQGTRLDGDLLVLETRLSHASGEWMESEYPVCRFPAKPQEIGSAMSYAKRYALFSIVGIAGGDDDDGEAANRVETPAPARKPPVKPAGEFFDVDTSQVTRDTILFAIDLCSSEDELRKLWTEQAPNIKRLHAADREAVESVKEDRKASLKGKAA
jgi:ERF superfamily